jgi:hypothetical protein
MYGIGLALLPLAAMSQVREPTVLMNGHLQSLKVAGFPVPSEAPPVEVPTPVPSVGASKTITSEALSALVASAKDDRKSYTYVAETARVLGFVFEGDEFLVVNIPAQKAPDAIRVFSVAHYHNADEIIFDEIRRVDGRKEARSCLVSADGVLRAAALTVKVNGSYIAKKVPNDDAQAGCRALLDFWVQYYRDNLKKF